MNSLFGDWVDNINNLSKDYINLKLQNFNIEKVNKELQDKLIKINEEKKSLQIQICNTNSKNKELNERLNKISRFVINYG
jgi:5-bromo-4-chloroindolyl phosphate hydrolysis protein